MSHLYLPWGSGERYNNRTQSKNQFASNLELHKETYEYQEPIQRQRSPSLPPIHQLEPERQKENIRDGKVREILNRNLSGAKRFAFYDEDGEGDTSGYGSETVNHMNKRNSLNESLDGRINPVLAWQQEQKPEQRNVLNSTDRPGNNTWVSRSPRSSTGDEGRPRWGDRGVATGRLWEPTTPNARLPQMPNQNKGTPSWVERGLNMIENSSEVLVIDQSSTNSGQECDRLSCNGSEEGRTFLRGQNIPLEPEVKAQRENKRIKAIELQSAILSQLEDREKRRQEEREMKLREERLEEIRLQRQQEQDRLRLEEEKRKNEERMAMEQRKLETLKKALEDAERKAREDKEKRFNSHKVMRNINCQNQDSNDVKPNIEQQFNAPNDLPPQAVSPTKSNRTYSLHSAKSPKKEIPSQHQTEFSSPRSGSGSNNLNLFIHSVPPLSLNENQFSIVPIGINGEMINGSPSTVQLAVLVPQNMHNLCNVSLNSLNITENVEGEKILTPSKFRSLRTKDAATQTDSINSSKIVETEDLHRDLDKTYSHIDENAPQDSNYNTLKKDRRFRSEERYKKELENRPKWGVNRPAAQYKKQSEKDPFYSQKRKMRQKYRPQQRQYLSQSSEDSRSPSPPARSEKNTEQPTEKHRNSISQSYWRHKKSTDVSKNNFNSEINSAFEYNNEQTAISNSDINNKSPKMSPTKRLTLSQKFINDKYGNKKLWIDDISERNQKYNMLEGENRKKIIEQLNVAKREYLNRNVE